MALGDGHLTTCLTQRPAANPESRKSILTGARCIRPNRRLARGCLCATPCGHTARRTHHGTPIGSAAGQSGPRRLPCRSRHGASVQQKAVGLAHDRQRHMRNAACRSAVRNAHGNRVGTAWDSLTPPAHRHYHSMQHEAAYDPIRDSSCQNFYVVSDTYTVQQTGSGRATSTVPFAPAVTI